MVLRRLALATLVFMATTVAFEMSTGSAQQVPLPLPPPPTIPAPPIPDAADPVLGVAGPAAAPVCGLAGLFPGLLGSQAAGLPFDPLPLIPYFGPVIAACGVIPAPSVTHTCEIDAAVIVQAREVAGQVNPLTAILPIPAPVGTLLDTVIAAQAAGFPVPPDLIAQLVEQLQCVASNAEGDLGSGRPVVPDAAVVAPPPAALFVAPSFDVREAALAQEAAVAAAVTNARTRLGATAVPAAAVASPKWRPGFTLLLALAVIALLAWAWRAERRDGARWRQGDA
jgi:hypothetical protein